MFPQSLLTSTVAIHHFRTRRELNSSIDVLINLEGFLDQFQVTDNEDPGAKNREREDGSILEGPVMDNFMILFRCEEKIESVAKEWQSRWTRWQLQFLLCQILRQIIKQEHSTKRQRNAYSNQSHVGTTSEPRIS